MDNKYSSVSYIRIKVIHFIVVVVAAIYILRKMGKLHSEDYGLYHENMYFYSIFFLFYYEMESNQFNLFFEDKYSNRRSRNNTKFI